MLIFLDIDGVMVPARSWTSPEILSDGFPAFSPKAVYVLKRLINQDTTVILTTSHKSKYSVDQWKNIFERRGVQLTKLKSLSPNNNFQNRKEEVLNWFELNKISENFIIIDDDKSLNDLPINIKKNLIQTSPLIGLTESHLDEINNVLSGND